MERKSERSSTPVNDKQIQSNGSGSYIPPEKKPQSSIGKIIVAGLLMVTLGGGAYFASKQMVTDGGDTTVTQEQNLKKELVDSILALQDEDYDQKARKIKDSAAAPHTHDAGHDHTSTPAASDVSTSPDPQSPVADLPEASPESDPDPEAEARKLEEDQKAQLAADTALMQQLSDEALARQTRAEAAIKKLREEQNRLVQAQAGKTYVPKVTHAVPFPSSEAEIDAAALGLFKAILTKCYIHGHDVHWVNEDGAIIEHVLKTESLYGTAAIARNMINQLQPGLIVIIYEKGYEVYGPGGVLIKRGKHEVHSL